MGTVLTGLASYVFCLLSAVSGVGAWRMVDDGWTGDAWMGGLVDEWIDGRMDGWVMHGWVGGWLGGLVD